MENNRSSSLVIGYCCIPLERNWNILFWHFSSFLSYSVANLSHFSTRFILLVRYSTFFFFGADAICHPLEAELSSQRWSGCWDPPLFKKKGGDYLTGHVQQPRQWEHFLPSFVTSWNPPPLFQDTSWLFSESRPIVVYYITWTIWV